MILKYLFDRVVAALALVILCPFLLVVALLIRITMPDGPVFFRQTRVGRDGKLFRILKFRTMYAGSDDSPVSVAGELRITPLGAWLRRFKLDEWPELWNVLIGDMSFVGPRPDVPGYADALQGADREILRLRPGITGPATLKYRHEEELLARVADPRRYNDEVLYPDKVRINRYYLQHYSFWMDMKLIWATLTGAHFEYGGETI